MEPRWFRCEACEDYYCALHDMHVFECPCPNYEDCLDEGFDPYEEMADPPNIAMQMQRPITV